MLLFYTIIALNATTSNNATSMYPHSFKRLNDRLIDSRTTSSCQGNETDSESKAALIQILCIWAAVDSISSCSGWRQQQHQGFLTVSDAKTCSKHLFLVLPDDPEVVIANPFWSIDLTFHLFLAPLLYQGVLVCLLLRLTSLVVHLFLLRFNARSASSVPY